MPIVINQNLYTSLGMANGKEPIGVDVVIDESAKVYSVLGRSQCAKVPACPNPGS